MTSHLRQLLVEGYYQSKVWYKLTKEYSGCKPPKTKQAGRNYFAFYHWDDEEGVSCSDSEYTQSLASFRLLESHKTHLRIMFNTDSRQNKSVLFTLTIAMIDGNKQHKNEEPLIIKVHAILWNTYTFFFFFNFKRWMALPPPILQAYEIKLLMKLDKSVAQYGAVSSNKRNVTCEQCYGIIRI